LQDIGGIDTDEMLRVFNMGLGLMFVADPNENFADALEVGRVVARGEERVSFRNR
jgi:phosphoribosylaminoimidazole (AIR) synthetase